MHNIHRVNVMCSFYMRRITKPKHHKYINHIFVKEIHYDNDNTQTHIQYFIFIVKAAFEFIQKQYNKIVARLVTMAQYTHSNAYGKL